MYEEYDDEKLNTTEDIEDVKNKGKELIYDGLDKKSQYDHLKNRIDHYTKKSNERRAKKEGKMNSQNADAGPGENVNGQLKKRDHTEKAKDLSSDSPSLKGARSNSTSPTQLSEGHTGIVKDNFKSSVTSATSGGTTGTGANSTGAASKAPKEDSLAAQRQIANQKAASSGGKATASGSASGGAAAGTGSAAGGGAAAGSGGIIASGGWIVLVVILIILLILLLFYIMTPHVIQRFINGKSITYLENKHKYVEDYQSAYEITKDIMGVYYEKAYEDARGDVENHLSVTMPDGSTISLDKTLMLEAFDKNEKPTKHVDYVSILAAYAVVDDDFSTSTVEKFESALNDTSGLVKVTYGYENGYENVYEDATYTKTPVYKYEFTLVSLNASQYKVYLSNLESALDTYPEGYDTIKTMVVSNLDSNISMAEAGIKGQDEVIDGYKDQRSEFSKEVVVLIVAIDAAPTNLAQSLLRARLAKTNEKVRELDTLIDAEEAIKADYEEKLNNLKEKKEKIEAGTHTPTVKDINWEVYGSDFVWPVSLYYIPCDDDGNKIIDHYDNDMNGVEEDRYISMDLANIYYKTTPTNAIANYPNVTQYTSSYYMQCGKTLVYPTPETGYYSDIGVYAVSGSDALTIFGLTADGVYKKSKGTAHEVSNIQMFNMYYESISNSIKDVSVEQSYVIHKGDLTDSEIEDYLAVAKLASSNPAVSKNRLQLIKNALVLKGAVTYQKDGKATGAGWDNKWWKKDDSDTTIGLNSPGFVQWAYWTTFGYDVTGYGIAKAIEGADTITADELLPGDLAIRFDPSTGSGSNQIGIFLGKDTDGNNLYIYMSAANGGIVVSTSPSYRCFYRINLDELEKDDIYKDEIIRFEQTIEDETEMKVIAECLEHEGGYETGFIACCEASCNYLGLIGYEVNEHNLYLLLSNQLPGSSNYCESYKYLYVWKRAKVEPPTAELYQHVIDTIRGNRTYIKNSKVGFWRSPSTPVPSDMVLYTQEPAKVGNKFLYYK